MSHRHLCIALLVFIIGLSLASTGFAKVTAEEAARLGKDLTFIGAERAGNAEDTIPAWEGGLTYETVPNLPRIEHGQVRPHPFPDDKPLFTITAGNAKDYADKLSPGQLAFFKRYPTWRMQVYQSRRTATYPERIQKAIISNATTAELSEDGLYPVNFKPGPPFPIPKNGNEAILNQSYAYLWDNVIAYAPGRIVLSNGTLVDNGSLIFKGQRPFHMEGNEGNTDVDLMQVYVEYLTPPRRKGEIIMYRQDLALNYKIWSYFPGQRRVRRAPAFTYDTPDPSTGNMGTFDDTYMYNGKIDRYDWKLVGKKEMYIAYNNFGIYHVPMEELLTPKYMNPDLLRWELHRVWVVEATLKKGKRHIYAKRVFYLDEDTWQVTSTDKYNSRGELWRLMFASWHMMYEIGVPITASWIYYDLTSEDWYVTTLLNGQKDWPRYSQPGMINDEWFTPEYLRRAGRR